MPIKPENKNRYPENWPDIVKQVRERSKGNCENCKVENYAVGYRDETGRFIPTGGNIIHDLAGCGLSYPSTLKLSYNQAKEIKDGCNEVCEEKHIVIVLTVAHLDHIPENVDMDNLRDWCQRCHNRYDIPHRKLTRRNTKFKNQLTLF